jgi:hypothetical protein
MSDTTTHLTADKLDAWVDWNSPFRVYDDGTVSLESGAYSPEVYDGEDMTAPEVHGSGWKFVDGYSGQHRYSGPVMHASEYLGGRMAEDILGEPGVYVLTAVENVDNGGAACGWAVLRLVEADS